MFEWNVNIRFSVGLPGFSKLVETIHDYVWEGEDEDE